jgi:hypothetical protein
MVSKTERMEFPAGGTLHLEHSIGNVTVEGWDQPQVEITTTKSTQDVVAESGRQSATHALDKVRIAAAREGNEVVITTDIPAHRPFGLPYPFAGTTGFDLEYRIKVPRTARIVADHQIGEVNVDNVTGDIEVTLVNGEIMLHLPETEKYTINAKSSFGNVYSDFPGPEKLRFWLAGHHISHEDSEASHKLNLKVLYGDIVILKTRVPSN